MNELFPNEHKAIRDELEWNQFIRLGDMMGDGLHHEPGNGWITREYRRLARKLVPEIKEAEKKQRQAKNVRLNAQLLSLIEKKRCSCGGKLKQSRSGSKICYCTLCNNRYKAVSK